ncbi:hypothetical protein J2128_000630 [Methanomicrobium sp. W14]|uniref:hypothetical protein n=1 Tax=Methanomicrobium sp. W14 TaxID=2817839 RepID=UPI001AE9DB2F|nr:hypothetical protein [Methanomicrobium sp. W14]MBP2132709.1 hypothetical protein [Methanomicrobium sp. W14]
MKFTQEIKKNPHLAIVTAVAILAVICIVLFLSGFFYENKNYKNEEVVENMTFEELNETINDELESMELGYNVRRWEIDEENKEITLYEIYMNDDQIAELEGKTIGGWNVLVQPDTDYINERKAVMDEIDELKKDPELQILAFQLDSSEKRVVVWIRNYTPENKALHGKVIRGWTIFICTSPTPPPTEQV